MAIHALPNAVVRTIGSSQSLTDPVSVVKELVDNALDARATNIITEISSNSLDLIQVRDNGHGIAPEDRAQVARRHCTSKITSEDDLRTIGGSSLGFRGEALASTADLSGSLVITTRIEGEDVAMKLNIDRRGEVMSQSSASSAVGTIVRITDFIKSNPVRRQIAMKNSESSIRTVKKMLQRYAFARPQVRFSLKVLKARNDLVNWVYAPLSDGPSQSRHAAFSIVGHECASQCEEQILEHNGYLLSSFLPRQNADPSKISDIGSFPSIDCRPVSPLRGVVKQMIKLFREALKQSNPARFRDIKDPFIYLAMSCPQGTYDANVEPAKDDLMFDDMGSILQAARMLFASQYSKVQPDSPINDENNSCTIDIGATRVSGTDFASSRADAVEKSVAERHPGFWSNMYDRDEEDMRRVGDGALSNHVESDFQEMVASRKDATIFNPWTQAKLNAPVRQSPHVANEQGTIRSRHEEIPFGTPSNPISKPVRRNEPPTPRTSSPMAGVWDAEQHNFSSEARRMSIPKKRDTILPTSPHLQTPQSSPNNKQDEVYRFRSQDADSRLPVQELMSSPQGTPLDEIPVKSRRTREKAGKQGRDRSLQNKIHDRSDPQSYQFARYGPRPRGNADRSSSIANRDRNDPTSLGRLLSPPQGNHDIRSFVNVLESKQVLGQTVTQSYPSFSDISPSSLARRQRGTCGSEHVGTENTVSGSSFVSAGELNPLGSRLREFANIGHPAERRHGTGRRSPLQEVDGNTPCAALRLLEDEGACEPEHITIRKASRRLHTGSLPRTKSSSLPLERTPFGYGVQHLSVRLSVESIHQALGLSMNDTATVYPNLAQPVASFYQGFGAVADAEGLVANLHRCLVKSCRDGKKPDRTQLFRSVSAALSAHTARIDEDDEVMLPI